MSDSAARIAAWLRRIRVFGRRIRTARVEHGADRPAEAVRRALTRRAVSAITGA